MVEYTPGALGALFNGSSSSDKSVKKSKGSDNLIELFSKKKIVKVSDIKKSKANEADQIKTPSGQSQSNPKPKKVFNAANLNNTDREPKDLVNIDGSNIIGPTVIPSKENSRSSSVRSKKNQTNKRKRNNEEIGDEDEIQEDPKYSGPSMKYKVIEEDKKQPKFDAEQEGRTVFVGNLPSTITGKILKRKFKEHGEIETVRIRSVARPDMKTTKKVATIQKKFHENRNNVNAYVRFKEIKSAIDSCKLNGTEIDSHILRVDMAGLGKSATNDSTSSQQHDQNKAVFLGNVKFDEQEDNIRKHFKRCGIITDVRLVRDTATGIGKGFGYVNFDCSDAVEKAIHLNGSLLNNRSLRVSRAVNRPKQTLTVMEKKKKLGPFKPKAEMTAMKKKSFSKITKKKQKGLTEQSYQGTQIRTNKDKPNKSNKRLNKIEKKNTINSKKLTLPKKSKQS